MERQRIRWVQRCRFLGDTAHCSVRRGAGRTFASRYNGRSSQWRNRSHQPGNKVISLKRISQVCFTSTDMHRKVTVQDRYEVSPSLKSTNKVTIVLGLFTAARNPVYDFQSNLCSGRRWGKRKQITKWHDITYFLSMLQHGKTGKVFHEVLVSLSVNNQGSRSKIKSCQGQPTGF